MARKGQSNRDLVFWGLEGEHGTQERHGREGTSRPEEGAVLFQGEGRGLLGKRQRHWGVTEDLTWGYRMSQGLLHIRDQTIDKRRSESDGIK